MKVMRPVSLALLAAALLQAPAQASSLTKLLLEATSKYSDRVALSYRLPAPADAKFGKGEWQDLTYAQWRERSERVAAWLISQGMQPGEKVGILDYNNPEWAVIDLGVQLAGGVSVPFYPTLLGTQHNYIRHDTGMKFLFVMDQTHLGPLAKLPDAMQDLTVVGILPPNRWPPASSSKLKEVGITDKSQAPREWQAGVITLDTVLETSVTAESRAEIKTRIQGRSPNDLVTICYTSGTTSKPNTDPNATKVYPGKGVMLTHRNIASNVQGVRNAVDIYPEDVFLSVLPLGHMFERTGGYYVAATSGAKIAYARSPRTVIEDISEVRPTLLACVPLLFERFYNGAYQKASQGLLGKVLKAGGKMAGLLGSDAEKWKARKVGKSLRKALGGRLRFAVSGGAKLEKDLAQFFRDNVGVTILEGYGLTETSPVLTCNRPEEFQFGTVGAPIEGVEIRIAEDREILARGPNIMKGYLNMPEKTAETIDADGWFHTGDLGAFAPNGFLKIVGRKKLLFKLKNGEYVSPETIEGKLKHPLIASVMVVGDGKDYAAALIFPDQKAMATRAGMMGIEGSFAELCAHPQMQGVYQEWVDEALAGAGKLERIKKFVLVPHTLSVEKGELTPTLKLKRGVIEVNFKSFIDGLF